MALPVDPKAVLSMVKTLVDKQGASVRLMLFLDPEISDALLEEFFVLMQPTGRDTQVLAQVLTGDATHDARLVEQDIESDAHIFVFATAERAAALTAATPGSASQYPDWVETVLDVLHLGPVNNFLSASSGVDTAVRCPSCVVVEQGLREEAAVLLNRPVLEVFSAQTSNDIATNLAEWLSATLSGKRRTLATDLTFTKKQISHDFVMTTAWQNAAIGALPIMAGADMPVLAGNQIKMLFQLAQANDQKLDIKRVPDVVVTAGAALVSRLCARKLKVRFKPLVWIAKGGIAFGTTYVLGRAGQAYYEKLAKGQQQETATDTLKALLEERQRAAQANAV